MPTQRNRRPFFASILLLLIVMPVSRPAYASLDSRVDELFTALRDRKFDKATAHFNRNMKTALSADQLSAVWLQIVAGDGQLQAWKTISRGRLTGTNEIATVVLAFDHGKLLATVAVDPTTDSISGLYFKPMTETSAAAPPPTSPPYADASKFRSVDVTVGSAPWTLPGTLTIPNGSGPFPAVVLLAGSGPQDRDETLGATRIFKDIAEGLSTKGIVVLRYDKRTYAYKTLDPQKTTVDQEVIEDGVAAVKLLKSRPEVARDKVFVIGHSLGAMLAPEVAKRAAPVAGIVMLAPNGRKLPDVIIEQLRFLGQASPAELVQLEHQANEISTHKMPPTQFFFGAPASYYYDLDARNEVALARTLDVPILILHGERDYQVVDEDIRVWQRGLQGDTKVHVDEFPSLNHFFIAGEGKPGPAEYEKPGHVDVAVVGTIASFIANVASSQVAAN